jgi:purine-nucleoside phosphorylase
MSKLYDQIQEALVFIRQKTDFEPEFGLILGTGLGDISEQIERVAVIPYREIPHFPVSTVESHKGELVFGTFAGRKVVTLVGRFHYYEGWSMQQVTFPIRVLKFLGIQRLLISNAAGSVNGQFEAGDLVFIRDHINLQADNPLRGENDERLGPRFPDMLKAYDRQLNAVALAIAAKNGIRAYEGVYLGLQGPNLETPAEYNFAHLMGADVVGMSTVPEVLVARHMALPVFVCSIATNKCYPIEEIQETTLESVVAVAQAAGDKLALVIEELLRKTL